MPANADEPLAVWAAFLAHSAITAKLERELVAERSLPLAWYEVLLQIERAGRPLRMQELASSVLLSKSGLTRLVDRMEGAGLVEWTSRRPTGAASTSGPPKPASEPSRPLPRCTFAGSAISPTGWTPTCTPSPVPWPSCSTSRPLPPRPVATPPTCPRRRAVAAGPVWTPAPLNPDDRTTRTPSMRR